MKNKNFLQSVACAFRGIASSFREERNFKIYTGIALVVLALNILTSSGLYDYILLLALSCGVFSAEYVNTAVERLCDSFCTEENRDVRFAKDVSAAAVLVMGFAFFGAEGAVLVSNILRML
ncbi:MAG: diacylglycerol kinase family protein [Lachnospiraceae bacterium]|nr:diacylglycerol kinase family protein [Lachnospiraceae bacterium]